jgi:hypothetical protein
VTRPKPTIYGNCDSWSFIVGKKPGAYIWQGSAGARCRPATQTISTAYQQTRRASGGTTCGPPVDAPRTLKPPSRIVVTGPRHMPQSGRGVPEFYPKRSLALQASERAPTSRGKQGGEKICPAMSFFDHPRKKAPCPSTGLGLCLPSCGGRHPKEVPALPACEQGPLPPLRHPVSRAPNRSVLPAEAGVQSFLELKTGRPGFPPPRE